MTGHDEAVVVAFEPITAVPGVPPEAASWRSTQIDLLQLSLQHDWMRVTTSDMSAHWQ